MKKLLTWAVIAILFGFALTSCDDDDNDDDDNGNGNGNTEANYFPMVVNQFRIYQQFTIDGEDETNKTEDSQDSVVITESGMDGDNETYTEKRYEWNEGAYEDANRDQSYYVDGNIVYTTAALINNLTTIDLGDGNEINLPIDVDVNQWLPMLDFTADANWTLYENDGLVGESIQLPGAPFPVTFTKPLNISVENSGTETVEINGETYQTVKFTNTVSTELGLSTFNIPLEFTIENWYANGIGLVRTYQNPFGISVNIPVIGEYAQRFDGSESLILRHNAEVTTE